MSTWRSQQGVGLLGLLLIVAGWGCTRPTAVAPEAAASTVATATESAAGAPKPVWLAIAAPTLSEAVGPLADHRRAQGFDAVVSSEPPARALAALGTRPAFILLVGDDVPDPQAEADWRVPTKWRPLYRWRSVQRERFAADALWGDMDGDLSPDVAVGRLPVRSTAELQAAISKTLAYEKAPPRPADLRFPVWAGAAGYDPRMDALATRLLLGTIRGNGPPWLEPVAMVGDQGSPYCGWPPSQATVFSAELRRGGVLAALAGHSATTHFHSMDFRGRSIDFSASDATGLLAQGEPGPPTVLLTCEAGNFTAETASLAEALLAAPAGPVAVIGTTTESHPLTNYHSGLALLEELSNRPQRLGELWLASQRRARSSRSLLLDHQLEKLEGSLEEPIDTEELRRDQPLMYGLLGDPALRLRLPKKLEVEIEGNRDAGWRWRADRPAGSAELHVQLRAAAAQAPAPLALDEAEQSDALAVFRKANQAFEFSTIEVLAADAGWSGAIEQPGLARLVAVGPQHLHVATFALR